MNALIIFIPAIDPGFDEAGNIIAGSVASMFLWLAMINLLLNMPLDFLSSIAFFRIGRKLGMRCIWLTWIPGGNLWAMGAIADHYLLENKGKKGYMRWILPFYGLWMVFLWFAVENKGPTAEAVIALADQFLLIPMAVSIGGIVLVFKALNRVYRCCGEGDGVFQTVLGVFFSIPTPFCLLHGAHRLVSGRPPRESRPCRYV